METTPGVAAVELAAGRYRCAVRRFQGRAAAGLAAVGVRPQMFLGKQQADPELPAAALWSAVRDALSEEPVDGVLQVRVAVEADDQFTVEDNGPGLPIAPVVEGRPPALTEMLTVLTCGQPPRRCWTWRS